MPSKNPDSVQLNAVAQARKILPERAYVLQRSHSLFAVRAGRIDDFIATCFLIRAGTRVALVTASHALLREPGRQFVVAVGDSFHRLIGTSRFSALEGNPLKGEDPLDLEVLLLADEVAAGIPDRAVVTPPDFSSDAALSNTGQFLITGYPQAKQRVLPGQAVYSTPHSLLLIADEQRGREGFASTEHHLVLHYDQKQFFRGTKRVTSPKPKGLSGSAVWRIDTALPTGDRRRLQLAGVMIERHSVGAKVILATRVDYALRLLLGLDPTLREHLPSRIPGPL